MLSLKARSPTDADLVRKAQTDGIRLPQRGNPDAGDTGSVLQRLPSQALRPQCLDWVAQRFLTFWLSFALKLCTFVTVIVLAIYQCYVMFERSLSKLRHYFQRSWRSRLYSLTCSYSTRSPRFNCFSGEKSRDENLTE